MNMGYLPTDVTLLSFCSAIFFSFKAFRVLFLGVNLFLSTHSLLLSIENGVVFLTISSNLLL